MSISDGPQSTSSSSFPLLCWSLSDELRLFCKDLTNPTHLIRLIHCLTNSFLSPFFSSFSFPSPHELPTSVDPSQIIEGKVPTLGWHNWSPLHDVISKTCVSALGSGLFAFRKFYRTFHQRVKGPFLFTSPPSILRKKCDPPGSKPQTTKTITTATNTTTTTTKVLFNF